MRMRKGGRRLSLTGVGVVVLDVWTHPLGEVDGRLIVVVEGMESWYWMMMMLLMVDVWLMSWPMDELVESMVWVELVHFELSL